ncbi:MAG: NAD(P)/FAD-dependent oxidoreductase [Solirubrobacterales bacterium]|nr:NAD(P)/FAD-dependent oxidoreductase [Solirubrobacterales bacterium]MBV9942893.1 NAD(P)/FAD-dependent oxidoreductase [Solirubrobacterales bacterium]
MNAVVIGAGPNGLAAAIRLAEAGHPVTVLEAADRPGGAVRTDELTLPGFRHDTFSSVYPAGAASPVFARLPLERHGLRWIHPEACYAHPLPGGRAVALYRELERTAPSLDAAHPGDGDRWRTFMKPMLAGFDAIRATMLAGFPPVTGSLRLVGELGPLGAAQFGRLLPSSAVGLGGRLFQGAGSRAWLYGSAGHGDVPPTDPGSAVAVTYLNLMGHAVGWPSPAGGAERLTEALVGYLGELGGSVRTRAPVEAIDSAHGRVTGVRIAGGDRVPGDVVIATVMPHALAALAGDAFPNPYRALLRRYRYGPATLKVDWALDGPIPWEAPEPRAAGTVHVGGVDEELVRTIAETQHRLPTRPFLLLGQQSLADRTRAPEGKHTAWAYTHGPRTGVDWGAQLDAHVDRIEAQVERFAPGFRELILARHSMGPEELERRDRNLVGGDVGGGSYRLRQVVFRPVPGLSPYRTPLAGLYFGSAAAFPGGAVHGVPGDAAARAALADGQGRRGPATLARRVWRREVSARTRGD